jgi:hypothetical protein
LQIILDFLLKKTNKQLINRGLQKQQEMEHKAKAIKIEHQEEEDEAEKQQQKQPPRKVTKKVKGQIRDYNFLKSVKSLEELDNFRFKVKNNNIKKMEYSLIELLLYRSPRSIANFQVTYYYYALFKEKNL